MKTAIVLMLVLAASSLPTMAGPLICGKSGRDIVILGRVCSHNCMPMKHKIRVVGGKLLISFDNPFGSEDSQGVVLPIDATATLAPHEINRPAEERAMFPGSTFTAVGRSAISSDSIVIELDQKLMQNQMTVFTQHFGLTIQLQNDCTACSVTHYVLADTVSEVFKRAHNTQRGDFSSFAYRPYYCKVIQN